MGNTYSALFTFKDTTTKTFSNVASIILSDGHWTVKHLNTTTTNVTKSYTFTQLKADSVSTVSIQVA